MLALSEAFAERDELAAARAHLKRGREQYGRHHDASLTLRSLALDARLATGRKARAGHNRVVAHWKKLDDAKQRDASQEAIDAVARSLLHIANSSGAPAYRAVVEVTPTASVHWRVLALAQEGRLWSKNSSTERRAMLAFKHCVGVARQADFYDAQVAACERWLADHTGWGGRPTGLWPRPSRELPARVRPAPLLDGQGVWLFSPRSERHEAK